MRADNKGEGGTFALYALVRRRRKWLVIPAMIGGASLLADGIITPPISITSAIEGLKNIPVFHDISVNTIMYIVLAYCLSFSFYSSLVQAQLVKCSGRSCLYGLP